MTGAEGASGTGESRWERDPSALWRATPFATVVLPRSSEQPLLLAGTSKEIWDLLDVPQTATQLADLLSERYQADRARITTDLTSWLTTLQASRAVRSSS